MPRASLHFRCMALRISSTSHLPRDYEHLEQVAFFNLLSRVNHPAAFLAYAVPNQAVAKFKSKAMRVRFWAEGVRGGIPDLHIAYPSQGFHGLWIEMKRPGEKPRPEQVAWHERLREAGHKVEVCFSCKEAFKIFCDYLDMDPVFP